MIKVNFYELDGLGWVLVALIIGVATMVTSLIITNTETKQMELALASGCTQVYVPDTRELYWTNCNKSLQSK